MSENKEACLHAEGYKSYSWVTESFTAGFNTEYEYCFCSLCDKNVYTGKCRFTENLNREIPGAKEQMKMNAKESVSKLIKARFANEGDGSSLKQWARRLAKAGDAMAQNWFANKHGACDQARSEKSKTRITAERIASRNARRKSKKSAGAAAPATAPLKTKG